MSELLDERADESVDGLTLPAALPVLPLKDTVVFPGFPTPLAIGQERSITLAEDIDPEAATATYERGILTVRLPVAPRPTPRESVSISVSTS